MKNFRLQILLFVILLNTACSISGQTENNSYPQPKGYVNDFENILSDREEKVLDSLIRDFEKRTEVEITIVTIDSTMTSLENFDDYTLKLANYWGVGKKELNNGVFIGVSSTLRYMRIENGLGIEKILSDEETAEIINNYFIPHFANDDYFEGIKSGTIELMEELSLKDLPSSND